MAKFLDSPLAGVALGGGVTAVAQYGLSQIPYDGMGGARDMLVKWSNTVGLGLGLIGAGVLYFMKEHDTAKIAAASAVVAGAARVIDEVQVNMGAAAAAHPAAQPSSPTSTATQGIAIIEKRGFGAAPAVTLFGRNANVRMLGPSSQVASRAQSQNVAAFGGGHF